MTTEAQRTPGRTTRRPPRRLDWRAGPARLGSATFEGLRAARDVRHLLGFRVAGLRGRARRAAPIALSVLGLITLLVCVAPAFVTYPGLARRDALILLPTAYISVLVISLVSAAASGGGRELLPRDQAAAFPVSPTTDHLGALLMAPLNIAWLLQGWTVLALTSYGVGAKPLLGFALVPVFLWLFAGTALAQTVAWVVEYVRRGRNGSNVVRVAGVALGAVLAALIASDRLTPLLDSSPTLRVALAVLAGAGGDWWAWIHFLVWLLGISIVAVVVGAWMAGKVVGRPARDELRVESSGHPARAAPGLGLRRPGAHRPLRHLALGADAARHGGAGPLPGPRRHRRLVHLGQALDLPGAGRLRRRAAVRRELLVPRRPRRALARQPAGLAAARVRAPASRC